MHSIVQDVLFSSRTLLKSKKFAFLAVLYLALGIGGNATIFSVVRGLLFAPLPLENPERVVVALDTYAEPGAEPEGTIFVSPFNYFERKGQIDSFEGLGAMQSLSFNLTDGDGAEQIVGAAASSDLFQILGVEMFMGRHFSPEEDQPGGKSNVVLMNYGLWNRRFGADRGLVGKPLNLNGEKYTLIGILEQGFYEPIAGAELWIPYQPPSDSTSVDQRRSHTLINYARLKPGATREGARTELHVISQRLAEEYPDTNSGWKAEAIPIREFVSGNLRPALVALQAAAGFVLLIVCANVGSLMLLRLDRQTREIAVRTALGASRWRLLRRFFTEGMLLALTGASVGLFLTYLAVENKTGLMSLVSQSELSYTTAFSANFQRLALDGHVLGFTLVLTVLAAVLCSLSPMIVAFRDNSFSCLKSEGRSTGSARSQRFFNTLGIAEIAVALVLLVGAGLMVKSLKAISVVDPGFHRENALVVRFALPEYAYPEAHLREDYVRRSLERLSALPGVESVGSTSTQPFKGDPFMARFTVQGRAPASPSEFLFARHALVSPDYMQTMDIPLVKGRYFTAADAAEAPGVAIINQTMAERYWPDQDPVGRKIQRSRRPDPELPWLTVVGVAEDIIFEGFSYGTEPAYFLPLAQHAATPTALRVNLTLRTSTEPGSLAASARREVQAIDPTVPIQEIRTLDEIVSSSLSQQTSSTMLAGLFASIALLLTMSGIYGFMSYFATQRSREIGIRLALGARSNEVLRMIVSRGMILTVAGLAIGAAGAVILTRLLKSQLYGSSSFDSVTFLGAGLGLAVITFVASYLPARRASRIDPVVTLRYE